MTTTSGRLMKTPRSGPSEAAKDRAEDPFFIRRTRAKRMGYPCYACGNNVADGFFDSESTIQCAKCGNHVHDKPECREASDGRILCKICLAR